jgi:hypothetical protein
MKITKSCRNLMAVGGVMLALVMPTSAALADSPQMVVPPNSNAYGGKFSEWSAQWWQYVLSVPSSENPLFDPDGSRCAIGQRGPVWFLFGWFGPGAATRACSIPDGTALFFPVLNVVDVNTTTQTAPELRAETAPCLDATTLLSVTVDGVAVRDLQKKFRVHSEVFDITLPADNLFGLSAGTYSPAIDDGFYVMLKPLGVGPHTVRFEGASAGCPLIGGGFSVAVQYNLTVVPVSLQ